METIVNNPGLILLGLIVTGLLVKLIVTYATPTQTASDWITVPNARKTNQVG